VTAMSQDMILMVGREALLLMVLASLPPIGAAMLVGFFSSLFQATTQIQESTLSVVPKLCAAVLALVIAAPWIAAQLARFTSQMLLALPGVAQ
jgi:flagellar biosynthesis protein FliQ